MKSYVIFGVLFVSLLLFGCVNPQISNKSEAVTESEAVTDSEAVNEIVNQNLLSPYVGQTTRGIKALSQDDVEGLLSGSGTPFGGMAKPAELNGYPGPRHVLDAERAGQFNLTIEQKQQIESIYDSMQVNAIELGTQIIDIERAVDNAFKNGTITKEFLTEKVTESSDLYGKLRIIHLETHLSMIDILTPSQIQQYNELRGYTSEDPCVNVPEGHDAVTWRMHNNC